MEKFIFKIRYKLDIDSKGWHYIQYTEPFYAYCSMKGITAVHTDFDIVDASYDELSAHIQKHCAFNVSFLKTFFKKEDYMEIREWPYDPVRMYKKNFIKGSCVVDELRVSHLTLKELSEKLPSKMFIQYCIDTEQDCKLRMAISSE